VFDLSNQYSYAQGNPVAFWDPDGARSEAVARGVDFALFFGTGLVLIGRAVPSVGLAGAIIVFVANGVRMANEQDAFDNVSLPRISIPRGGWANMDSGLPGVLEIFRTDPCNSQCFAPPLPEGAGASSGFNFTSPTKGGSAISLTAPSFQAPAPAGCSPSTLTEVPDVSWAIRCLIAAQALVGVTWWRLRRRGPA
jgi:hypothetical protein